MKHKLEDIEKAFPWAGSYFEFLPVGWADITYDYLSKMDKVLKKYGCEEKLAIFDVKEKFGEGRFYYNFQFDWSLNQAEEEKICTREFYALAREWEYAVAEVCCVCGSQEDVKCHANSGGWIYYSCPNCVDKS